MTRDSNLDKRTILSYTTFLYESCLAMSVRRMQDKHVAGEAFMATKMGFHISATTLNNLLDIYNNTAAYCPNAIKVKRLLAITNFHNTAFIITNFHR
jgi:hypothetical protein